MGELVGYIPSTNNMERLIKALFVLYIVSFIVSAREEQNKKAISIFNVVKFKNDVCAGGGNQNGTCYTAEECSAIDGTASGTCAEGYGVCCIVSLTCGSSSKQNCTYMVQAATTAPTTNPCTYTICPMSSNICRIRLDFATFVIGGPTAGTFTQDRGACITDTFTTSSSAGAVPIICGTNTGQHMIVDSDGETCATASFTFGGTATNRAYDIKVLQFDCKNEMGGPTGCLQYFTTDMGTFSSFNYGGVPETADSAHLANQNYNVCIRRNNGKCSICYITSVTPTAADAATAPASFGLSKGQEALKSDQGTNCAADYLEILGLETQANVAIAITTQALATAYTITAGKICGMGFDALGKAQAANNIPTSVCTGVTPFTVRFVSDANEVADDIAAMVPSGKIGFSLDFNQQDC